MNSLPERYGKINRTRLSEEFYLSSLVEEGIKANLISGSEEVVIKLSILKFLKEQLKKYTTGDSSSVKAETAQDILQSITYTAGICLKAFETPENAIKYLLKEDISIIYRDGKAVISRKIKLARQLHLMVLKTMIKTDNITYNSTLTDGIAGFFKLYDMEFSAHRINITADYPVCNELPRLSGIEFIVKYLDYIYRENCFLNLFSSDSINTLLKSLGSNSKELVINIYETVLTGALGCIIAGCDVHPLRLSLMDIIKIEAVLSSKSDEEIQNILFNALENLKSRLNIDSSLPSTYIDKSMIKITASITAAVKNGCIDRVFTETAANTKSLRIHCESLKKMNNEDYKNTISEINECRYILDKISIMKERIHSLEDFSDMLHDAYLSYDDLCRILNTLTLEDLAVLYNKYKAEAEYSDESSKDSLIFRCMENLSSSLNPDTKVQFKRLVKSLETDE